MKVPDVGNPSVTKEELPNRRYSVRSVDFRQVELDGCDAWIEAGIREVDAPSIRTVDQ
jgi:hypothetical protein